MNLPFRDAYPRSFPLERAAAPTAAGGRWAFLRLLAASLVGAVLGVLLNVALLLVFSDAFRIRHDLELFRLTRTALGLAGFEILQASPVSVSYPLGQEPRELILFVAMAVVFSAVATSILALLAWPLMRRGRREHMVTTVVLTLACLPALALPAQRLARALELADPARNAFWLLLTGLLVGLTWWFLRKPLRRRRILGIGGSLSAALVALAGLTLLLYPGTGIPATPPTAMQHAPRPNVLLVSIDSLRADHLGCYGYARATSPAIDAVAAEGVRFATTVAPTSWTLPSHLTLLTGQSIAEHGVSTDHERLPLAATTLPEVLRGAGYRTVGIVGGPYLEARFGYAQGFESYDDYTVVARSNEKSHQGITSPRLVGLALDWLEDWEGSRDPFFLFLHLWDVHLDYTPPPPYDTLFDPDYAGPITGRNYAMGPEYDFPMDPADLKHVLALYDGEIAFTDHHLGRLLHWLKGRGLLDKTLVVVTSDHGEEFFEHGERGHRNNLYDESLLVPLLFRYPEALARGVTVNAPVRLQDVAPTILELAGLGPVPGFGARLADDPLSGRTLLPLDQPRPRPASGDLVGRWSFLRQPDAKVIVTEGGSTRLYDLREDPGEQVDVASEQAERARALEGQLRRYRERAKAPGGATAAAPAMDEGRLEMLRGLGYVD